MRMLGHRQVLLGLSGWQRLWLVASLSYLFPAAILTSSRPWTALPTEDHLLQEFADETAELYVATFGLNVPPVEFKHRFVSDRAFVKFMESEYYRNRPCSEVQRQEFDVLSMNYQMGVEALPRARARSAAKALCIGLVAWLVPSLLLYAMALDIASVSRRFRHKEGAPARSLVPYDHGPLMVRVAVVVLGFALAVVAALRLRVVVDLLVRPDEFGMESVTAWLALFLLGVPLLFGLAGALLVLRRRLAFPVLVGAVLLAVLGTALRLANSPLLLSASYGFHLYPSLSALAIAVVVGVLWHRRLVLI